jgi:hypothetical protein
MRKSEIFESFVKIAQERGLVSQADEKSTRAEHTEKSFSETNPRMDSLSIEQISKLYNTKPPAPKEMEYKRNIIENAHPESVVVSPSYDKLNGLVENENEGQAIRARIVMKYPDGHLTQRKYAKKNLLLSLVRVGNELDARDSEELRKLADVCLMQASETCFHKKAVPVVPIVIGIVGLIGAVYAYEHITVREGLQFDYKELTDKIVALQKETMEYGFGYKFSEEFNRFLADLSSKVVMLHDAVVNFQNAMAKTSLPKTSEELTGQNLISNASSPEGKAVEVAYDNLKKVIANLDPYFIKVHQNLNDPGFRERVIQDRGFVTELIDRIPGLRGQQRNEALLGNLFKDLNDLVENYQKDVATIKEGTDKATQQEQKAQAFMSRTLTNTPAPTQQAPEKSVPEKKPEDKDAFDALEDEFNKLVS